jgi:hypothetical protein
VEKINLLQEVFCFASCFMPFLRSPNLRILWKALCQHIGAHFHSFRSLQIYNLAQETIVLLLEFNPDSQALLEWVIDRCYTGSPEVADGCFNALAAIFTDR